ncbi:hypothetical protein GUJ93_ZPchr0003g16934 [Zizania palustris]|uniref:Uncharacterized protein n=1 Tax=Zizania palustris TaxID=103762 RepID=A0A8J5SHA6_ZIZPA|nr:hypothetical protein GUJ93_ZPchr0003g16934 [Zizania palustris]
MESPAPFQSAYGSAELAMAPMHVVEHKEGKVDVHFAVLVGAAELAGFDFAGPLMDCGENNKHGIFGLNAEHKTLFALNEAGAAPLPARLLSLPQTTALSRAVLTCCCWRRLSIRCSQGLAAALRRSFASSYVSREEEGTVWHDPTCSANLSGWRLWVKVAALAS